MAQILESRLILSADDKTAGAFKGVLDKVNAISKAQKEYASSGAKNLEVYARQVDGLNAKLAAIKGFKGQHASFIAARQQFRAAEADVQRLGRAMSAAAKPSKDLTLQYETAQRTVKRAAAAFQEKTAAVKAARAEMAAYGVTLNNINKHLVQPASAAPRRGPGSPPPGQEVVPHGRSGSGSTPIIAGVGKYLGPAAVGYAAIRAHGAIVDKHHDFQQAYLYQQAVLGMDEEKQKPLLGQAIKIGQDTKFSNADIIKAQTDIGSKLPKNLQTPEAIAAITEHTKNYALAMKVSMEEASTAMVSWMMSRGYDISTPAAAEKSSRRASNQMVEYAKSSGSSHYDILADTKFGAASGRAGGFSEEYSNALSVQLKRLGYEGAMSGTFVRAAASKLSAPTQKGQSALAAIGLNFADYLKPGTDPSVGGLDKMLKVRFGRGLSKAQAGRLREVFEDEDIRGDHASFTEKVSEILNDSFARKGKNGKTNAQDAERIAKTVNEFATLSSQGVDSERLMTEIITKGLTPALAKYLFGTEHGGRAISLDPKQLAEDIKNFRNVPEDRAESVAKKMQQGAQGEYTKMVGSFETFTVAVGEATDGLRSFTYRGVGQFFDGLTNLIQGKTDIGHKAEADLKKKAEADTGHAFNKSGRGTPMGDGRSFTGYDGYGDQLLRRHQGDIRRPGFALPSQAGIENLGASADEAKGKLDGLSTPVSPNINVEPVQKLGSALDEVLGKLERINGAVGGARKSIAALGGSVPSASPPGRGRSDVASATAGLSRSRETNQTDRDFS